MTEQAKDALCRRVAGTVRTPSFCYSYDLHGILISTAPINSATQTVVASLLRPRLFYLAHYPNLAGHPGECCMYNTMKRELYRPYVASDVYMTVADRFECAIK